MGTREQWAYIPRRTRRRTLPPSLSLMALRPPALPDVAIALVTAAATQAELWSVRPEGQMAVMAVAFGVGAVAVAFRAVFPLLSTASVLAGFMVVPSFAGSTSSDLLVWLLVALSMCAWCGFRVRPWWLGLGIVLVEAAASVVAETGVSLDDMAFASVLLGGAWLAGRGIGAQASATTLERERADLLAEQAQMHAAAAARDERVRIAREMHDVIAHSLSVVTLHVSGVRRLLRPDQHEERQALEAAERVGREAVQEMQRVVGVLRSDVEDSAPTATVESLEELVAATRAAGLAVELDLQREPTSLTSGRKLAVYRIIQEALTNARRHAGASAVTVSVRADGDDLAIDIVDNGRGMGTNHAIGHGLSGIAERAAAYGGSATVSDAANGGCAVRARIPLRDQP